jgi:alpha-tubulin suppressor-like RCC1 family protein
MLGPMSGRSRAMAWRGLMAAIVLGCAFPGASGAAVSPATAAAASRGLTVGRYHACALLTQGAIRCWGFGAEGRLGYGNTANIGDDETPAAAGPVEVGGPTAAVSAGEGHTCALLVVGDVRCWGFGGDGRLGTGSVDNIGDDELPTSTPLPVFLGQTHKALSITTGRSHTCVVLDDHTVRCWGFGFDGRLGYGNTNDIGDDELPGDQPPVKLGAGRTATAVAAGDAHTCALLDDATVRCWGFAGYGQLGYSSRLTFSDTGTPDLAGPVALGRGAVAITTGNFHTCALLDNGTVRCWGFGGDGELGYGNTLNIGDDEHPSTVDPVDLGPGRTAVAIDAGGDHTCAVLDDGTVRCWGAGRGGQLGYASTANIGDDETPGSVGPVDLGPGRTAVAISAGGNSTCARLDDGSVRCWGSGNAGLLGYCATNSVGDDATPGTAGPVALGELGIPGAGCAGPLANPPVAPAVPAPAPAADDGLAAQRARAAALRDCRASAASRAATQRRRARSLPASKRAGELRRVESRLARARSACVERYARTPGRVAGLAAKAVGRGRIVLTFRAPGTDGSKPPGAERYVVKQSARPIRTAADFRRASPLCNGSCTFKGAVLGATINLNVTDLARRRVYYYAVAARDNVTGRPGPLSASVRARTG